jgi:uncharacterized protein (TIGR02265 family)
VDAITHALQEASRHCDIVQRLATAPPSAKVRGLYMRSVESVLEGGGVVQKYRRIFPERVSSVRWYPLGELLKRVVVGGSLLAGPDRVHEGMFEIGWRNAAAVGQSLIGRAMLHVLSRDPRRLLQQGMAARRQTHSFGSWTLRFPEVRGAVVEMVDEYLYLESYLAGAAHGTFDAIGLKVKVEVVMATPYAGRHLLSW